jgi:hypothetical protein
MIATNRPTQVQPRWDLASEELHVFKIWFMLITFDTGENQSRSRHVAFFV